MRSAQTLDKPAQSNEPDRLIRRKELAGLLGIHVVTLWRWERSGLIPQGIHFGRDGNQIGWIRAEILAWIDSRPRTVIGQDAARE
jgi:predicted DNA-binding transcriptional regulator AlpA